MKNKLFSSLIVVVNYVIDRFDMFHPEPCGFFLCPSGQRLDINLFDMLKCIHIAFYLLECYLIQFAELVYEVLLSLWCHLGCACYPHYLVDRMG